MSSPLVVVVVAGVARCYFGSNGGSVVAFAPPSLSQCSLPTTARKHSFLSSSQNSNAPEEYSDFDGFIGDASDTTRSDENDDFVMPSFDMDDEDVATNNKDDEGEDSIQEQVSAIYQDSKTKDSSRSKDYSGIQARQFSLGQDFVLANYVGSAGFEEVTDWEYYLQNEDDPDDRKVVQPNLFDKSQPKRTRTSSGSVVCA